MDLQIHPILESGLFILEKFSKLKDPWIGLISIRQKSGFGPELQFKVVGGGLIYDKSEIPIIYTLGGETFDIRRTLQKDPELQEGL